jgi:hypothetical protein
MNSEKRQVMKGIEYLLALNAEQSELFQAAALDRLQYRVKHPTEIGVMKCMDGRVNMPVITKTPLGIIQPWRNVGGKFDLGWDGYQKSVWEWVTYAMGRGRNCLVIINDHFSRGDKHRGCRGFNYDQDAAKAFGQNLRAQFDRVFGAGVVYTIQCGIETDEEALIFRGKGNDHFLDLSAAEGMSEDDIREQFRVLYSDMPRETLQDLIPLALGNLVHVSEVRKSKRPVLEIEHREWVLAVGRGFDWLHEINTALIVGPFDPNLAQVIETAAGIIKGNLEEGRISSERGVVLMSCAPFREAGPAERLAEEKAQFLAGVALDVVQTKVPALSPYIHVLTATMNMETRKLKVLYQN